MSIYYKLSIPSLVALLLIILGLEYYWKPLQLEKAKQQYLHQAHALLDVSDSALGIDLLERDFASLYSKLDYLVNLQEGKWVNVKLYREDGKRLYPLFVDEEKGGSNSRETNSLLHHKHSILVDGSRLATLELDLDWSETRDKAISSMDSIRNTVLLLLVLALFITSAANYYFVLRPLRQLGDAARRVSEGDYKKTLPAMAEDEVGDLGRIFRIMTNELRYQKEALDNHAIVSMTDNKGVITYVNDKFVEISGYSRDELLGQTHRVVRSTVHPPEFFIEMWKTIGGGSVWQGEVCNQTKSNQEYWVSSTITPLLDERGIPERYISIRTDISKRKQVEDELIKARQVAEAASLAKSSFLANMSHEIRTPMNAIIGFSEVALQKQSLPAETQGNLHTIHQSARSLMRIINDILDLSKLESGKFSLESVCFHLPNCVGDTVCTLKQEAKEKSLALKLSCDHNLAPRVMSDSTRLRQILLNLVGNAIKFTEHGSVKVSVQPHKVAGMVYFTVSDTGIGMTEEQVSHVFESFSQGDASTTRRFGGTGLGTTIARQLVEQMGGEIWVESEPDKGSTFRFTLPLNEATETSECLFETTSEPKEGYLSPRLFHILLAEDVKANAMLATMLLERLGHTVQWVQNGREALEESQAAPYDVILMDIMMPEMDGIEATRAIRQAEEGSDKRIPIIALTASVMVHDREKCLTAGMDGIEGKPLDFNHLLLSLEELVPAGVGIPNTSVAMSETVNTGIDFSGLAGSVDYNRALESWGQHEIYARALRGFAEERAEDAAEIKRLLDTHPDDCGPARRAVHALRGLASNLGMDVVAKLAARLEAELVEEHRESVVILLDELRVALQEVVSAVGRLSNTPEEVKPIAPKAFDVESVKELLQQLCTALEALNPDVVEPVMEELSEYFEKNELAGVSRAVETFDFDGAKEHVLAMAEKLKVVLE